MVLADDKNGRVTLAVLATKLDYVIAKVDSISQSCAARDKRIDKLEDTVHVVQWIGGVLGAIFIGVSIAWAKTMLGL